MSGREPSAVDIGGRTAAPDAPPVPMFARLLPAGSYAGRSRALVLRSATAARRTWLAIVSGIFEPVFYLVAMGQGLGSLVGTLPGPDGAPISYAAFIAPGLLAASAMNGAVFDSTYNVFFKLKYNRLYDAVLATPLGPIDIALGEIAWALVRGGMYAVAFLAVMGGFGLLSSPWALLALPAALVVAFGFAAVGMAATTYMRSWQDFDLVTLAILPMFLFATTFYPLSVYPRWLQLVVEALPLFHAVELMRGLTTGAVHLGMLGHLGYFLVMIVGGLAVASRRLGVLLLK
jgi:lipooligosaccharide transport system permease protein